MKSEFIELEDLKTARDAMESWVDAFQDEEPEAAIRVNRVIADFNRFIERMSTPNGPQLRLVKPEDIQ